MGSPITELLKALAPSTRNILAAGFRKCGIMPWNPHEVISQLPSLNVRPELVGESFKDYLKKHRSDVIGTPGGPPPPKKKLKVSPGKSISPEEVPERVPKPAAKKPAQRRRKRKTTTL